MLRVLAGLALVASVSSLTCFTCDSFLSCNNPVVEFCPATTQCYTVTHQNRVQYKGCAVSCRHLPYGSGPDMNCHVCNSDKCNIQSSHDSQFGSVASIESDIQDILNSDESQEESSIKQRRHIGGGVQVGSQHGGIGSGAVVNPYGNQPSIGSGVQGHHGGGHVIGSGASQVGHHQNGVGSGASLNTHGQGHGIGSGVETNRGGIGSGVSGNGHHHGKNRNRRAGIGGGVQYGGDQNQGRSRYDMGQGVRPDQTKSAFYSMITLPVVAVIAKLFL